MANSGAPHGNKNRTKNRPWTDAIRKALADGNGRKLRLLADRLVEKAMEGDMGAIKELGDRIEGKCMQPIEGHIDQTVTVEIVRFGEK